MNPLLGKSVVYATFFFLVIHLSFRLEAVFAQIYTILIVITLTELAYCDVFFVFLFVFFANFANYSSSIIW